MPSVLIRVGVAQALAEVLPVVASRKVAKGGYMILRPDSGEPTEAVLQALAAGEKVFGVDTNAKGFKTPRGTAFRGSGTRAVLSSTRGEGR